MALYSDGGDVTLGDPSGRSRVGGGGPRAGELAASRYRDGQVVGFERVAAHVADGLACLAEVERFRAKVGGSDGPVSIGLRVTSVYRRKDGIWRLVHRTPIRSRRLKPQSRSSAVAGDRDVCAHPAGTSQGSGPSGNHALRRFRAAWSGSDDPP